MWACHNEREESLWVSPREPDNFITRSRHGQGDVNAHRQPGVAQQNSTSVRWTDHRMLPFWPMAMLPGCGQ
jgi:hypothetical protein